MLISIILSNPSPESFNHALAKETRECLLKLGHKVHFHDLYQEHFDPILLDLEQGRKTVLPPLVKKHCDEIAAADGIVIIHPNWWGQPPAIMKGWVDRVLRPGTAYEFLEGDGGEGIPKGLLKAKAALVLNTTNTPLKREMEVFGDPLENLWKTCIFDFCGVRQFHRRVFGVIVTSTPDERWQWLREASELVAKVFPKDGAA